MAAIPTVGVFDLDGMDEVTDVKVAYAAMNWRGDARRVDGRLFAVGYEDARDGIVKVDNRALSIRQLDAGSIRLLTLGGHVLKRYGAWDLLGWGVVQTGDWGVQDHDAWAYAIEAGHQWPEARWKPWLRLGLDQSSGDADPADGKHGTFFAVLPTPRIYARHPFFNSMNLTDAFLSLVLRPHRKLTMRADYHHLDLTESKDLWYAGGGAFDRRIFGFAGRPSGGFAALGDLFDASLDWKLSDRWLLTFYHGFASGGSVARFNFPDGPDASFGYVEATHRF
jgi:hypothetical protein